jgi:hypothetical protein
VFRNDLNDLIYLDYNVIDDGEDLNTLGWEIYDNKPKGAAILNVYDDDTKSNVIEFNGHIQNGYRYIIDDNENHLTEFSINFENNYMFYFDLETSEGEKSIAYSPKSSPTVIIDNNKTVRISLGKDTKLGVWETFTRDLNEDLNSAFDNIEILTVKQIRVVGTGKVDNIKMFKPVLCGKKEIIGNDETTIKIMDESSSLFGTIIYIPNEAFETETEFSFSIVNNSEINSNYKTLGLTLLLQPEGTQLLKPLTITLPLTSPLLVNDGKLKILHIEEGSDEIEIIKPINYTDNFVTFNIDHFSTVTPIVINNVESQFM